MMAFISQILPMVRVGIAIIAILISFVLLAILLSRIIQRSRMAKADLVRLKLTPLAGTTRTNADTAKLFDLLHGIETKRSVKDRILFRHFVFAIETHSTYESGIWHELILPAGLVSVVRSAIGGFMATMSVEEIAQTDKRVYITKQYRFTGHYAFPLREADQYNPVQPAYITNSLTDVSPGDEVVLQLVCQPIVSTEARQLSRRLLSNEDLLGRLNDVKIPILGLITRTLSGLLLSILDLIGSTGAASSQRYDKSYGAARISYETAQVKTRQKPARTLSTFELELMQTMHRKLTQPLFRSTIRVGIRAADGSQDDAQFRSVESALSSFDVQSYQSIKRVRSFIRNSYVSRLLSRHLPSLFYWSQPVLSSTELASLFELSSSIEDQADNLNVSLSRTLVAPVSLKQGKDLDVVFGANNHRGNDTPLGLTGNERERHMYIVGGTGQGKTTMLQYQIIQDMKKGKGLAVVDPHGDMAELLLSYVPDDRIDDVIYFNPDDLEYPLGLNLLEMKPDLEGLELARERDLITESVVSIFRKVFSEDDSGGHRIEYVLRNTIHTALTVEGATLFTVLKLLQNAKYRKGVIKQLEDEDLKDFWNNELGQAGGMQRVKMNAGITAKIGRYNSSIAAKRILSQKKSTIDFDDIINSGKILICNFSKALGEDVSELFGISVLAKLQLASLQRARIDAADRRPFYLYVDEFQNFATPSFVQLLSEARKYKLYLTMAEQSTAQQDDQQMVSIILANVGTVICFRTGSPDDERKLLPLFAPYIKPGEIANLPSYNFYAKLSASVAQEPLSGITLLAPLPRRHTREVVIESSRSFYAGEPETKQLQETKQPNNSANFDRSSNLANPKTITEIRIPGE